MASHPRSNAAVAAMLSAAVLATTSFAQQQSANPWANVRTLSLDAETVRVTTGATPGVASGVFVSTGSASPAPSPAPTDGRALTVARVRDVVHAHADEIAGCAAGGASNGRVHGSVTLRFVLDGHGNIRDAAVPQSTMTWSVPRCLVAAVGRWRFPAPPQGLTVVVVYPLAFVGP